jgi:two-component system sensor histidine kinase MtrB
MEPRASRQHRGSVRRGMPAARRAVPGRLRAPARFVVRGVLGRWRRSIQLRVVSATVLLGVVVVLFVGQSLLSRITADIVSSRQRAVVAESQQDFNTTQEDFLNYTMSSRSALEQKIQDTVFQLAGRPTSRRGTSSSSGR